MASGSTRLYEMYSHSSPVLQACTIWADLSWLKEVKICPRAV
jgi:hypothetical protein